MMSVATIDSLNRERAEQAAQDGLTPYVFFTTSEVDDLPFPFPYIGDHRPEGWDLVVEHFVDSSGFGTPGEPALTVDQFQQVIRDSIRAHAPRRETVGWAITSAGQFQVYVGEFVRAV